MQARKCKKKADFFTDVPYNVQYLTIISNKKSPTAPVCVIRYNKRVVGGVVSYLNNQYSKTVTDRETKKNMLIQDKYGV